MCASVEEVLQKKCGKSLWDKEVQSSTPTPASATSLSTWSTACSCFVIVRTDFDQLSRIKPILECFSSQNSVWLHSPFALKHGKAPYATIILVWLPPHGKNSARQRYAEGDLLSIPNACRIWFAHLVVQRRKRERSGNSGNQNVHDL